MRRRRRCDKHNLDLTRDQPDLIPNSDTYPVTPITPPAAFLSLGYKRPSTKGKGEHFLGQHNNNGATDTHTEKEIAARFMFACDKWQIEIFSNVKFNVPKKNCFFSLVFFSSPICMGSEGGGEGSSVLQSQTNTMYFIPEFGMSFNVDALRAIFPWTRIPLFFCHLGAHVHFSLPELVYTQFFRFV